VEDVVHLLPEEEGAHEDGVDEDVVEEAANSGIMMQTKGNHGYLCFYFIFCVLQSCGGAPIDWDAHKKKDYEM
jgi:hypothetical protein